MKLKISKNHIGPDERRQEQERLMPAGDEQYKKYLVSLIDTEFFLTVEAIKEGEADFAGRMARSLASSAFVLLG